jgi:hypothetical protein
MMLLKQNPSWLTRSNARPGDFAGGFAPRRED